MVRLAALPVALSLLASAGTGTPLLPDDDGVLLLQQEVRPSKGARREVKTGQDGAALLILEGNSTGSLREQFAKTLADPTSISAALAEYIAMTLFVVIGCGSAMGIAKEPGSAWVLQVSLTFGLAITSLAYAVGAYSGGQINCAVTLGLVLVGQISVGQGVLNFIAQMLGSVTGAYILTAIFPKEQDRTGGLGSNGISEGFGTWNAFISEAMMTFLLMFVVLETAVNPNSEANRALACVAIGFAVFLAHTVLIPIDGCSINPTRSFGPAFVAKQRYGKADTMKHMYLFFAAPLTGAALAAGVYGVLCAV